MAERNWKRLLIRQHKDRGQALSVSFTLHGIFAGLLLSGVVMGVPVQALGIGCAAIAGLSLVGSVRHHWKADQYSKE